MGYYVQDLPGGLKPISGSKITVIGDKGFRKATMLNRGRYTGRGDPRGFTQHTETNTEEGIRRREYCM